jgi:hypothetical protein
MGRRRSSTPGGQPLWMKLPACAAAPYPSLSTNGGSMRERVALGLARQSPSLTRSWERGLPRTGDEAISIRMATEGRLLHPERRGGRAVRDHKTLRADRGRAPIAPDSLVRQFGGVLDRY